MSELPIKCVGLSEGKIQPQLFLFFKICLIDFICWSHLRFTAKLKGTYRDSHSPHMHSLPHYQHPHQMVHVLQLMNLHGHVITTQSPHFTLGFPVRLVHSVGLDKCVMMCSHHYSTIQSIFTALKILCALPVHPSFPITSGNHCSFFTVSIVLPFPECHIVGIIQYVRFLDWLL